MNTFYRSYLLRLWLEQSDPPTWRAMLESPVSGERQSFSSLEKLYLYLEQETQQLQTSKNTVREPNRRKHL
jgi:hypothetical protein